MKKIFFLFVLAFLGTQQVSAADLPDIDDDHIPVLGESGCTSLGGRCSIDGYVTSADVWDYCDNSWPGKTEDFAGMCTTGGFNDVTNGKRSDCCVPTGTVTSAQIDAVLVDPGNKGKGVTQWISESVCESTSPAPEGFSGQCVLADSNIIADFDGSCTDSKYSQAVGYCGSFGGNSVCCTSKEVIQSILPGGSDTGTAAPLEYGDYQLLESIPGSSNNASDLPSYLQNIYQAGLVLIVLGAIFMIGMGGFTYIASAGNTHTMAKGKGMIKDALYGLIIALATWLILNIINPDLVNLTIETPGTLDFTPSVDNEIGLDAAASGGGGASGGGCAAIPDSQLVTFPAGSTDGKGTRRGTADTVKRFMAMRTAALKEGVDLRAGNAYRSPEEAEALWKSHGCQIVSGKTVCSGSLVAKPCSLGGSGSNHTRGTAIDIQTSTAGTNWMRKNAAQYGFYNKVASERWHWSDTGH